MYYLLYYIINIMIYHTYMCGHMYIYNIIYLYILPWYMTCKYMNTVPTSNFSFQVIEHNLLYVYLVTHSITFVCTEGNINGSNHPSSTTRVRADVTRFSNFTIHINSTKFLALFWNNQSIHRKSTTLWIWSIKFKRRW